MSDDLQTEPPPVRRGTDDSSADAFDVLYQAEFPRLAGALYAMSGTRSVAEEVAQDAFAQAWSRWGRVADSPSPAGWVYTTGFRLLRRRLRARRLPPQAWTRDRADPWDGTDQHLDLLGALRALPASQQHVVVLRHIVGLSVAETAERCGTSEAGVRSALYRAMAALRSALDQPETGECHEP